MTRFLNFEEFYYMLQGYEDDPASKWNTIFTNLLRLFNGTTLNCYQLVNPGYLKAYYTSVNSLIEDILAKYGHRYIYKKFEGNTTKHIPSFDSNGNLQFVEQHISDLASFMDIELFVKRMINGWVERNGDRVIRTLSASELIYDPIENYNRMEDMDEKSTGSKTMTRELAEDYDPMEFSVNAPISAISASLSATDQKISLSSITVADHVEVKSRGEGASTTDTENGKQTGTASITKNGDTLTATTSTQEGSAPTNTESVTTYDDDNPHVNRSTSSTGDVAQRSVSAAYSLTDQYGNVTITKDNPEQYKDTEAFENFGTNRSGTIHGNIGVTTTQQMIEQEYLLRNKRLVDDFINECMNEIFLQCGA